MKKLLISVFAVSLAVLGFGAGAANAADPTGDESFTGTHEVPADYADSGWYQYELAHNPALTPQEVLAKYGPSEVWSNQTERLEKVFSDTLLRLGGVPNHLYLVIKKPLTDYQREYLGTIAIDSTVHLDPSILPEDDMVKIGTDYFLNFNQQFPGTLVSGGADATANLVSLRLQAKAIIVRHDPIYVSNADIVGWTNQLDPAVWVSMLKYTAANILPGIDVSLVMEENDIQPGAEQLYLDAINKLTQTDCLTSSVNLVVDTIVAYFHPNPRCGAATAQPVAAVASETYVSSPTDTNITTPVIVKSSLKPRKAFVRSPRVSKPVVTAVATATKHARPSTGGSAWMYLAMAGGLGLVSVRRSDWSPLS